MVDVRRLGARTRSAVFAPIGDLGRAAGVEKRLAEAIRSGILLDGEKLPSEVELAALLGVATVTAREALVGLRARNLVTTLRGRGGGSFVVGPRVDDDLDLRRWLASMTRVDLADRGIHHATLLAGCAELAAERASDDDLEDLRGILPDSLPESAPDSSTDGTTDGTGEPDLGHWRHTDTEFHLALAALTQSARLSREVMRLEAEFGALLRLPLAGAAHRAEVRAHQLATYDAIATRDADRARTRIRARVRCAIEELAALRSAVR